MAKDSDNNKKETITTRIWEEIPEDDNPFAAKACYCSGYDVYGDLLGKATWVEYLYLLFKLEKPTKQQCALLEGLAVALANPGPRDHSVRAAMNAGVGGSTHASALMAALAVGAGNLGGGREVYWASKYLKYCKQSLNNWARAAEHFSTQDADVWHELEHAPGFDPYGNSCSRPVQQTLNYLATLGASGSCLSWICEQQSVLENQVGSPYSMVMVAAAAFLDAGFNPDESEMLYLLLRLPGAAAHSLEQEKSGWKRYPFFGSGLILNDDPKQKRSE
ncbi:citryl-CoA lyase [bacterium SCSIO 12696]|nr:citryl-CoA lyase [bacterium SCSIO 12696]